MALVGINKALEFLWVQCSSLIKILILPKISTIRCQHLKCEIHTAGVMLVSSASFATGELISDRGKAKVDSVVKR